MKSTLMNKAQAAGAQVAQHTPVPWVSQMGVGCGILYNIGPADARPVLGVFHAPDKKQPILIAKANAEFVVRACNCHEELLEALKVLVEQFDAYRKNWRGDAKGWVDRIGLPEQIEQARKAIETAEGKL